jgi:hypothetical protein
MFLAGLGSKILGFGEFYWPHVQAGVGVDRAAAVACFVMVRL